MGDEGIKCNSTTQLGFTFRRQRILTCNASLKDTARFLHLFTFFKMKEEESSVDNLIQAAHSSCQRDNCQKKTKKLISVCFKDPDTPGRQPATVSIFWPSVFLLRFFIRDL